MSRFYLHIGRDASGGRTAGKLVATVFIGILLSSCSATTSSVRETIEVEGTIAVRGNEPFTQLVLETVDRNYYVLKFASPDERALMQNDAPGHFLVRGDLFRDVWGGRAWAHLRVGDWQRAR